MQLLGPLLLPSTAPQVFVTCLSDQAGRQGLAAGTRLWEFPEAVPQECCCTRLGVVAVPPGGAEACKGFWELRTALPASAFCNFSPYRPPVGVQAAGGVILRAAALAPEVLLIHRRGCWDLPKGKCKPGEAVEACALREVAEELGIPPEALRLLTLLGHTVHAYPLDGHYAVKVTCWFLMETTAETFVPQPEEGIVAAAWVSMAQAQKQVGYATLEAVLAALKRRFAQQMSSPRA